MSLDLRAQFARRRLLLVVRSAMVSSEANSELAMAKGQNDNAANKPPGYSGPRAA